MSHEKTAAIVAFDTLTPEILLRQLLRRDDIKALAVAIMWDDDSVQTKWTKMMYSQLAYLELVFRTDVQNNIKTEPGTDLEES